MRFDLTMSGALDKPHLPQPLRPEGRRGELRHGLRETGMMRRLLAGYWGVPRIPHFPHLPRPRRPEGRRGELVA